MRIAIIGAGNVGGTLGKMWAARGHEVAFGVRSPNDAKVQTLVTVTGQRARAVSMKDAVVGAEVVALATPWSAVESAIKDAGDLRGKVLVDATNPLKPDLSGLALGHSTSAGAHVAAWAPGAKMVAGLAGDLGFDLVDCGPLTQARLLDPLAMLWISMVYDYGAGPNIGIALLRK